ncbi:RQC-minor-2 family DNA-binding protein [Guptibacillus hwajinpoensis]|uniref:Ribosomal protein S13 n=1 Tax=Guptibacillus hwajinpoensis TaxID=208199 RepID=A0ABU0K0A5_9BACL|nr:RQC-minor-2 family DNA-binding protein [Alkalihalobacillus hemicentroti]MDQ0482110.1 ribosomal protein S13 [Alkalihalobacillus hemicentroti]
MSVEHHVYHFEAYPLLAFVPMGKKNKRIRTLGQKVQKGIIHRVHEQIKRKVAALSSEDIKKLQTFIDQDSEAVLPVPLDREDELYPQLIKPELLLWNSFSSMHGLPIHQTLLYPEHYLQLSSEKLDHHLDQVIRDYLFCAELAQKSRDEWESEIIEAFKRHPFIQLARKKREVIEAVERMNRSPLISLLNTPEDLSYWRHRVGVVLRAYRDIPSEWLWGDFACHHEREMLFHSSESQIEYHCEECAYSIYYQVDEKKVYLNEEVNMERARKRIVTIERQFNEMVEKTPRLLEKIEELASLIHQLEPYDSLFEEALKLEEYVTDAELASIDKPQLVTTYKQIRHVVLPEKRGGSPLMWLSNVSTETIEPFKPRKRLPALSEAEITHVRRYLETLTTLHQSEYADEDVYVEIKQKPVSYGQVKSLISFVASNENDPLHVVTKVLTGQATNAIRAQGLHENNAFGMLEDWEEKHVVKIIKQLEKDELLKKLSKGYAKTDKAKDLLEISE